MFTVFWYVEDYKKYYNEHRFLIKNITEDNKKNKVTKIKIIKKKKKSINKKISKLNNIWKLKSISRKKAREIKWKIYVCESCLRKDRKIEIHHIDHNALNNNISNLIWLCDICHYEIHKDEPIWILMYNRIIK